MRYSKSTSITFCPWQFLVINAQHFTNRKYPAPTLAAWAQNDLPPAPQGVKYHYSEEELNQFVQSELSKIED